MYRNQYHSDDKHHNRSDYVVNDYDHNHIDHIYVRYNHKFNEHIHILDDDYDNDNRVYSNIYRYEYIRHLDNLHQTFNGNFFSIVTINNPRWVFGDVVRVHISKPWRCDGCH